VAGKWSHSSSHGSSESSSESSLPACPKCEKPPLTRQQKNDVQQANLGIANSLAWEAANAVSKFVLSLEDHHNTYVKLDNAISGGHFVRFQFLQGDKSAIHKVADKLKIKMSEPDALEIPEGHSKVLAAVRAEHRKKREEKARQRWVKGRAEKHTTLTVHERRDKFISPEDASALMFSNRAIVGQMASDAKHKFFQFLDRLEDSHNYVRLYGAITNGHVVDYELVNGDRKDVKSAGDAAGLEVSDTSITTKGTLSKGNHDSDSFEANVPSEESSAHKGPCGGHKCPSDDDVVIVPAPGQVLNSNKPNTMLITNVYTDLSKINPV